MNSPYLIRKMASEAHKKVNHDYDGESYITHLDMVYNNLIDILEFNNSQRIMYKEKNYHIGEDVDTNPIEFEALKCACFTHDMIEDCRYTYNDLINSIKRVLNGKDYAYSVPLGILVPKKLTGMGYVDTLAKDIADLTFAVSNEKGKSRKDRANSEYYKGIRETKYASILKIADRLANIQYSKFSDNDKMFMTYNLELNDFLYSINIEKDTIREVSLGELFIFNNSITQMFIKLNIKH